MINSLVSDNDEKTQQESTKPLALVGSVWPKEKMPIHVMIFPLPDTVRREKG